MASEYAKQIATLVAEALQDGTVKIQEPATQASEPKSKRLSKDGKRRDIAFPSKAQVQKTMSGKAQLSKPVNKFKVIFPSDNAAKLGVPTKLATAAKLSRTLSSRLGAGSPEQKPTSEKLFTSPNGSFRESDYADDELSGPRRLSMNVTEIKGSLKPWKLTPTKGVLFSNPVYMSSPTKTVKPSPVKIVPGKKESTRRRSGASANPLSSSITKVTFKREAPSKPELAPSGSTKREYKSRKSSIAPPSRYVEMVPLDGPQDSSILTMLDVLNVRSPSRPRSDRSRLKPLDANNVERPAERTKGNGEDLQCRVSHFHTKSTPHHVENVVNGNPKFAAHGKQVVSTDSESDKENTPIPRCAPSAVKDLFLRSVSSGHALNRTLSRKHSGATLQLTSFVLMCVSV